MADHHTINLLMGAASEIKQLRAQIAIAEPKAHAYDTLAVVTRLASPAQPYGYGVDLVWELEKKVEEMLPQANLREATMDEVVKPPRAPRRTRSSGVVPPPTRKRPGPKPKVKGVEAS